MREAMRSHAMNRTPAAYEPIYRQYVASIAEADPEAVLSAQFGSGITATKVNGTVVLNIPGIGQVPYGVAVKQGFISVRGA